MKTHSDKASSERQTLTVEEAARLLGVGRSLAYDLVRRGEIPSLRLGGKWVVPKAALERMLSQTEERAET